MPLELAGIGIESDYGTAVKVIPGPGIAVPIGSRVSRAPERQIRRGVIGTGFPDRCTAVFPRVAGPGFVAGLAGSGDCVEAPAFLTGVDVECGEKPANAELAARRAFNYFVF